MSSPLRLTFCAIALACAPAVFAADAVPANPQDALRINMQNGMPVVGNFTLGPSRITLDVSRGEERTVEVQLTNQEGLDSTYVLTSEDFAADVEQEGSPSFYDEKLAGPYPARLWLSPEVRTVTLHHGERAFIRVVVHVPNDADPGDHMAALVVKRQKPRPGPNGIAIEARVAVLFILTVKGDVVQDASLTSFQSRQSLYWFFPAFLRLTATNKGTVHLDPQGMISIRNIFGITVDEIPITEWVVLRNSARTRTFSWNPRFALGRYTATTALTMYNGKPMNTLSTSFWMIPLLPVLLILLAIFSISFFVQYFFSRYEVQRRGDDEKTKKK